MLIEYQSLKKNHNDIKNSFKYFIGYIDNDVIRPLCTKLPQMTGYVRKFECGTTISLKISDKKLLKKYNQIWKKVKSLLKINLTVNLFMGIMINTYEQK